MRALLLLLLLFPLLLFFSPSFLALSCSSLSRRIENPFFDSGVLLSPALPFDLAGELWTMKKFLKTKKTQEAIAACPGLTTDGAGAIYLFTCESPLYKELNAKLRARDRAALKVRS